jgi:hypothetical protein
MSSGGKESRGKVVHGGTSVPMLRERIAGLEKKARGNRESIKQLESDVEELAARLAEVARERDAALGKIADYQRLKFNDEAVTWQELRAEKAEESLGHLRKSYGLVVENAERMEAGFVELQKQTARMEAALTASEVELAKMRSERNAALTRAEHAEKRHAESYERVAELEIRAEKAEALAAEAVKIDGRATYWREQFERQLERAEALAAKGDARAEARGAGYEWPVEEYKKRLLEAHVRAEKAEALAASREAMVADWERLGAFIQKQTREAHNRADEAEAAVRSGAFVGCGCRWDDIGPEASILETCGHHRDVLSRDSREKERLALVAQVANAEARADAVGKAMNDLRRAVDDSANWKTDPSPPMRDLVDMREAMRKRAESAEKKVEALEKDVRRRTLDDNANRKVDMLSPEFVPPTMRELHVMCVERGRRVAAAETRVEALEKDVKLLIGGIHECEGDGGCRGSKYVKELQA